MNEKIRLTVYLSPQTHKRLKHLYAETGERMTNIIELACRDYLDKKEKNGRSKKE